MSVAARLVRRARSEAQEAVLRSIGAHLPDRGTETAGDVVVSVTSFPARIHLAAPTLLTLLRQSVRPRAVVLTLSRSQFGPLQLPYDVARLADRGLTVRWVDEDLRSYKKVVPVALDHPDATVVTADDDTLYPRHWLRALLAGRATDPQAVLGHRGTRILLDPDGGLLPYPDWPGADAATPSARTFLTGVGGILYPPGFFDATTLDMDTARRLAPTADDVWLKAMSLRQGRVVRRLAAFGELPATRASRAAALRSINVSADDANGAQLTAVLDHFDLWDQLKA
jgi:hypothetical protein